MEIEGESLCLSTYDQDVVELLHAVDLGQQLVDHGVVDSRAARVVGCGGWKPSPRSTAPLSSQIYSQLCGPSLRTRADTHTRLQPA